MSNYKGIKGFQVQTRTEDPSPTEAQVGDFYYNSSTGQFKTINDGGAPIGTWASGGALNTRKNGMTAFGADNTTSIAAGGSSASTVYLTQVENYNGTSWTEIAEFTTGRNQAGGFGSATAGLIAGGVVALNTQTNSTQTWNGSSWSEANELNTSRGYMQTGGNGTSTAGLISTGYTSTAVYNVESWDGSSWSEVAEPNSTVYLRASAGNAPNTASIIFGGGYPRTANTETWDGSSWTEVANLNTARADMGAGGTTNTNVIGYGGRDGTSPPGTVLTESWNGSTWTEVADQSVATIFYFGDGGSATSALKIGGSTVDPPNTDLTNVTEEWSAAEFQIKSVTTS